jgi:hypothetical protein
MRLGIERDLLGRDPSRHQPHDAGREHERPPGPREDGAHRLDRAVVGPYRGLEVLEVVDEPQVNHAFGLARARLQALWFIQIAAKHLRPNGGQGLGRGLRAGQPQNPVAGGDELGHDGRADETRRASDEYTHENTPFATVMSVAVI